MSPSPPPAPPAASAGRPAEPPVAVIAPDGAQLRALLDLEPIETWLFRGRNEASHGGRLFGGQVLAQALAAASRTLDAALLAHSLHGYFLHPGDPARPVLFEVEPIRDGRSFATRRVVAIQRGHAILSMDASFQVDEPGFEHGERMPDVPEPEALRDDVAVAAEVGPQSPWLAPWSGRVRPFETRSVVPLGTRERGSRSHSNPVWIRLREPAPDDPRLCRAILAYASDMGLVSTAALPHAGQVPRARLQMASLDHALWFHREFRLDDWLLFDKRTTSAASQRGHNDGAFFDRRGRLVASVAQEGLMRVARAPADA